MKSCQLIIYDQINTKYLMDEVDHYIYFYSKKLWVWPYWVINTNKISQILEYAISKSYINDISQIYTHKKVHWSICEDYYIWIYEYCKANDICDIYIMIPSENYLYIYFQKISDKLKLDNINVIFTPNTQFLISHEEFAKQYDKPPVMENFYRWMRKKFDVLMDGDKPVGGKRNYDSENRKFDKNYKNKSQIIPNDNIYIKQAEEYIGQTINDIYYPVSRQEALNVLSDFVMNKLDRFGELEDAMYIDDQYIYHSMISTSINFGMLTPLEVIKAVENANTDINNKEWFIRQILWWREYMYHRFYYYKDNIYNQNILTHDTKLPQWFWRPEESPLAMNCINTVLKSVKNTWYSHHITRLMIIWNFCLLMWYNPHDVNKRFWEMYTDAFERVVTPNVLGMSQFADGWNLATKPYISSANYINNMSNYCSSCFYDPKIKSWPKACPMNYLYWNFVDKNKELFKRQPYMISNLSKVDIDDIRRQSEEFILSLSNNK